MENYFKGFTVEYIEWNKNSEADDLAKAAAHSTPMPADLFFKYLRMLRLKQFSRSLDSSILLKRETGELQ
jgi:hypothetical protein